MEIEVQENFLSFESDLVAEQLTYMDAVSGDAAPRNRYAAEPHTYTPRPLSSSSSSAAAVVQKGGAPPLPGLRLVSEGQEAQQAQRPHRPRHDHAVQRGDGLRGQHGAEAPADQAACQSAGHPALDRNRSGVSNTQKLLVFESHRVGAAVEPSVQAEEGVGLCAQVSPDGIMCICFCSTRVLFC